MKMIECNCLSMQVTFAVNPGLNHGIHDNAKLEKLVIKSTGSNTFYKVLSAV